jgi:hypothetical protein
MILDLPDTMQNLVGFFLVFVPKITTFASKSQHEFF